MCDNYLDDCNQKCPNGIAVFDCTTTTDETGTVQYKKQCTCIDDSKSNLIYKQALGDDTIDNVCQILQEKCTNDCYDSKGTLDDKDLYPCSYDETTDEVVLACACSECSDDNLFLKIFCIMIIFLLLLASSAFAIGIVQSQRQNKIKNKRD